MNRSTIPNKPITQKTPDFKVNQLWVYQYTDGNTRETEIIGRVIAIEDEIVRFKDIRQLCGDIPRSDVWGVSLPLSSGDPKFKYLGEREDFPELYI